jgi:aprataxin and PNK-like factor
VDCFRKNPQHRKDFKHTKKVNPKREAKAAAAGGAKKRMKDNKGEDGSYDDSFIDNDSDEGKEDISGDEESELDWVPEDDED